MLDYNKIHNEYSKILLNDDSLETVCSIASMLIIFGLCEKTYKNFSMSPPEYTYRLIDEYSMALCYNKKEFIDRFVNNSIIYIHPLKKWVEHYKFIAEKHPEDANEKYKKCNEYLKKFYIANSSLLLSKLYSTSNVKYQKRYYSQKSEDDDFILGDIVDAIIPF